MNCKEVSFYYPDRGNVSYVPLLVVEHHGKDEVRARLKQGVFDDRIYVK